MSSALGDWKWGLQLSSVGPFPAASEFCKCLKGGLDPVSQDTAGGCTRRWLEWPVLSQLHRNSSRTRLRSVFPAAPSARAQGRSSSFPVSPEWTCRMGAVARIQARAPSRRSSVSCLCRPQSPWWFSLPKPCRVSLCLLEESGLALVAVACQSPGQTTRGLKSK